jgi:hypothetical protein
LSGEKIHPVSDGRYLPGFENLAGLWGGKEVMTEKNLKLGAGKVRMPVPALA